MAQLMARLQRESMRSGSEWLLPVLESRPANTIGSRPPSSSGRATYTQPALLVQHLLQLYTYRCAGLAQATANDHSSLCALLIQC